MRGLNKQAPLDPSTPRWSVQWFCWTCILAYLALLWELKEGAATRVQAQTSFHATQASHLALPQTGELLGAIIASVATALAVSVAVLIVQRFAYRRRFGRG